MRIKSLLFFLSKYRCHLVLTTCKNLWPLNRKSYLSFWYYNILIKGDRFLIFYPAFPTYENLRSTYHTMEFNLHVYQGWGRLQKHDYDYNYDYTMITKNDYDYDYSQRKLITITIMITNPQLEKSLVITY